MDKPAILGGPQAIKGVIAPFNRIGPRERSMALVVLKHGTLSGFLGGKLYGGRMVSLLESDWRHTFWCGHAIAINSATSGLLAACAAIDLRPGDLVMVSPYTMSATAAVPAFMGAKIIYCDIESDTFCMDYEKAIELIDLNPQLRAIIVTNLFGHPARLHNLRSVCDAKGIYLIEDNAQAPFAMEDGQYTGTIGHIGVFSLNVHKHIQCGEGGIVTTKNAILDEKIRGFINHGEMAGMAIGLNLRMTEITAGIAIAQLGKGPKIVEERIRIAERITKFVKDINGIICGIKRPNCNHVYYLWPFLVDSENLGLDRHTFVKAVAAEGLPLVEGYVDPLYRLKAKGLHNPYAKCPNAEKCHDVSLAYYENCGYDPTPEQVEQIGDAFHKVASHAKEIAGHVNR